MTIHGATVPSAPPVAVGAYGRNSNLLTVARYVEDRGFHQSVIPLANERNIVRLVRPIGASTTVCALQSLSDAL